MKQCPRPWFSVLFLALLLVPSGCGGSDEDSSQTATRPAEALLVRATSPELRSMERSLPMTAKVVPLVEAEVPARVQGVRIEQILADVGDRVEKNQVVAVLDTVDLEHRLAETRAAVKEAEQREKEAQIAVRELAAERSAHQHTLARKKQVWERLQREGRGVAQDDVEAARYEHEAEVARQIRFAVQIEKAESGAALAAQQKLSSQLAVEKAQRELEFAQVKAPIAGIITERLGQMGQVADLGQAIFRMYDADSLVARAKLAQHHLRHVQEGQLVRYKGDAFPDITIVAKVALIEPSVDEGNGMVGIRLVLDAEKTLADPANARSLDPEKHAATRETIRSGRILIPGMFVSGAIILEHKPEAVAIPRKAISYARGRPFIFLIEPATPAAEGAEAAAHRVRRVYFTEGLAEEGYVEFVPSPGDPPLGPGALIVQVGQDRLRDGDPVRIESAQDGGGALSAEEDARPAGSSGSNGKD